MAPRKHLRSMCRECTRAAAEATRADDPVSTVLTRVLPWLRTDPVLAAETLARQHERLQSLLLRHPSDLKLRLSLGEIDGLLAYIFDRWRRFRRDAPARGMGPKCEWCQRPLQTDALWTKGSHDRPARGFCDAECLRASRVGDVWRRMQTAERVRQHRLRQRLAADLARTARRLREDQPAQL